MFGQNQAATFSTILQQQLFPYFNWKRLFIWKDSEFAGNTAVPFGAVEQCYIHFKEQIQQNRKRRTRDTVCFIRSTLENSQGKDFILRLLLMAEIMCAELPFREQLHPTLPQFSWSSKKKEKSLWKIKQSMEINGQLTLLSCKYCQQEIFMLTCSIVLHLL